MPEAWSRDWSGVSRQDVETHSKRLGNMVLLQADKNSMVGNKPFDKKRKAYRDSTFLLTQQVGQELLWTVSQVEARQKSLAQLAVKTWPLD